MAETESERIEALEAELTKERHRREAAEHNYRGERDERQAVALERRELRGKFAAAEDLAEHYKGAYEQATSPAESCLAERERGSGGCGACSICCEEAKERAEQAEYDNRNYNESCGAMEQEIRTLQARLTELRPVDHILVPVRIVDEIAEHLGAIDLDFEARRLRKVLLSETCGGPKDRKIEGVGSWTGMPTELFDEVVRFLGDVRDEPAPALGLCEEIAARAATMEQPAIVRLADRYPGLGLYLRDIAEGFPVDESRRRELFVPALLELADLLGDVPRDSSPFQDVVRQIREILDAVEERWERTRS